MENKNNNGLITVIIILGLLVIILGSYIVYDQFILDSNSKNDHNIKNDTTENQESNNNKNVVSKLDNNKAWIHDADYNLPTSEESYYVDLTNLISAKDLIVPYININSDDAQKANQEIYELYKGLIDAFNKNIKDKKWYTLVKYKDYTYDNTVSVVITTETHGTDVPLYKHYTYSFNLDNGKLLSYEEAYKITGLSESNINDKVNKSITNALKQKYSNNSDFNTYNNKSINNYKTSVNNGTIKFFIDGNNKLNIIVTLEIPAGRGQFDTIITVE